MNSPLPRVTFLGPEGSFSSIAARKLFRETVLYRPAAGIPEVFDGLAEGAAEFAVVPMESPQGGTVQETVFGLCRGALGGGGISILLEADVPIHLALLGRGPLDTLRVLYSHPQAIARAREWLKKCAGKFRVQAVSSTARAAQMASRSRRAGALASPEAAKVYGLKVLERQVGRSTPTTFIVLGRNGASVPVRGCREHRTSAVFTLRHRPGSLATALLALSRRGLNLTRILSIPVEESPGEYMFLAEWTGRAGENRVDSASRALSRGSETFRPLGSYPIVAFR